MARPKPRQKAGCITSLAIMGGAAAVIGMAYGLSAAASASSTSAVPAVRADSTSESSPAEPYTVVRTVTASFLGEDVFIAEVRFNGTPQKVNPHYDGKPGSEHVVMLLPGPVRPFTSIVQLQGLVTIDTPAKALEFVRMRTSQHVWMMFSRDDGYPLEAEVVSERQVKTLPDYGVPSWGVLPPYDTNVHQYSDTWGNRGVLSNEGFTKGGFQEPIVERLPEGDGFLITRWTYIDHSFNAYNKDKRPRTRDTVQKISEWVLRDGTYGRREIEVKAAPKLPYTRWCFPYRL